MLKQGAIRFSKHGTATVSGRGGHKGAKTGSHHSRRQKNEDARQVDKDFHEEGGSELLSTESPGALNMHDKVQSQEDMEHVANDVGTHYGSIFN